MDQERVSSIGEKVYVSVGAVFSQEGKTSRFAQLYEAADKCMYKSKETAGNQITYGEF